MSKLKITQALRAFTWRTGRKLYTIARRELSLGPESNGEYWLLAQVARGTSVSVPVFLDIGARFGDWTDRIQTLLGRAGAPGSVHAFEPSADSHAFISERFKSNELVATNRMALSDQSGIRDFFVVGKMAGVNSLFPVNGASVEQVECVRLDDYLAERQIAHVALVKSDAEGLDFHILQGAADLFRLGRVDVWQFEYNQRWLAGRAQLKDVFDFIADKPYRLGKLYANGIETYEQWHPELERFFEANYVLVRRESEFEKLCTPVRFNHRNVLEPVDA